MLDFNKFRFLFIVSYTGILLYASSKWYMVIEHRPQEKDETESYCYHGKANIFPFNTNEFTRIDQLDKMFMLETSGRATLNPRQACAVESAARETGLKVN